MSTSSPARRVTRQRPHQIDPIEDGDLDAIYSGLGDPIADGQPLAWALIASVIEPAWTPPNEIFGAGPDWQAVFKADGHSIPTITGDKKKPRTAAKQARRPTVWLIVETEKSALNEARDVGRLRVWSLLGLIQLKLPQVRMPEILWEGAFNPRNKRTTVIGQEYTMAAAMTEGSLKSRLLALSKVRFRGLSDHVSLSLRWYARAWTDRNRIDRFVHLWLAAVVLIDHGFSRSQRDGMSQRDRVDAYIGGFPAVSPVRRANLAADLKASYSIRNEVVHEGNISNVSERNLARLEESTTEILRLEMERV